MSNRRVRIWLCVSSCIFAACSSKKVGMPIVLTAPTQATVSGRVLDALTGLPHANAQLALGGAMTTSASDGSFTFATTTGRAVLTAKAAGYLDWQRELAVGSAALPTTIRLHPLGTTTTIGPAGGTVTVGPASIVAPPGAFPTTTTVTATFVAQNHLDAVPGPHRWPTDSSFWRLRSLLAVDVDHEPVAPVTVKLPIAADADAAKLALFNRDADGRWMQVATPDSTAGGIAAFSVSHFTDDACGEDTGGDSSAMFMGTDTGDSFGSYNIGDTLGTDFTTTVTFNTATDFELANSTNVTAAAGTTGAFGVVEDNSERPFSILSFAYGWLRFLVIKWPFWSEPTVVHSGYGAGGVRGTAFDMRSWTCSDGRRTLDAVDVAEGAVAYSHLSSPATPLVTVNAGQAMQTCANCDDPSDVSGCPPPDMGPPDGGVRDGGICAADGGMGPPGGPCPTCAQACATFPGYTVRSCTPTSCGYNAVCCPP